MDEYHTNVELLLPAVDHVDRIADEHGQNDDDKAEQGIVVHRVLLFSERGEFVDDEVEALRKRAGSKDARIAGDNLAIELHAQRRGAGDLGFLGLDDLELRAAEYLAGGSSAAVITVGRSCTVFTGSMTAMSTMPSFIRQSGNRLMSFWMTEVLPAMQQMPSSSSTMPSCSIVKCATVGLGVASAERK